MPDGDVETFHEDGRWHNRIESHGLIDESYDTKAEAIEAGRELARGLKVEHIVRDRNGRIGDRSSYGHDPRDIRG